ncbi:hypothetical protein DAPPUDRAFT_330540 [Daphnia pulex]|uniref:Uncharacterized protein n=1 Tax=Daphnia pulex TaxID=6669 RepID=E9HJV8_DAPPU|nr:hypothetical protein DAPPUDRAFT_330540 [Daphnia pulex]|eukprot:EFX67935.1 hypothetical protein DAPPUDRAFT_330540 [Daphnia pulex]
MNEGILPKSGDNIIKAALEIKDFARTKDFHNQLESLITLSVRSISNENANVIYSVQHMDVFLKILEGFVLNLNETHASSDKALADFDVKITPLIHKFANLVVELSKFGDCQKEYEAYLARFLNSLPIHPTLRITPWQRTKEFMKSLLSLLPDEISEEPAIQTHGHSCNEKLVTNATNND